MQKMEKITVHTFQVELEGLDQHNIIHQVVRERTLKELVGINKHLLIKSDQQNPEKLLLITSNFFVGTRTSHWNKSMRKISQHYCWMWTEFFRSRPAS